MAKAGYNWRNTLSDYTAIAGILAGFSITFIALILSGNLGDIIIPVINLTFGQLSIIFFGISTALFIGAAQYFLLAKTYNLFNLSDFYYQILISHLEKNFNKNEENIRKTQIANCRHYQKLGRNLYNASIFLLFIGLFFVVIPYNLFVSIVICIAGIIIEMLQYKKPKQYTAKENN